MGVRERREKERELRRQGILKAARALFTTQDYEQVSMERIASEAELAKGTLYLYFDTKEDLVLALVTEELDQLLEKLEKISTRKESAAKRLLAGVRAFYRFTKEHEVFHAVMMRMNMQSIDCSGTLNATAREQFVLRNQRLFTITANVFTDGVKSGELHLTHSVQYTVMQWVFTLKGISLIMRQQMYPPGLPMPDEERMLIDIASQFIRGMERKS
jgi:AcrR family transcriptional regulator